MIAFVGMTVEIKGVFCFFTLLLFVREVVCRG